MKPFRVCILLPFVGIGIAVSPTAQAEDPPKAADLLDRHIETSGGKKAHESIKTLVVRGTMSLRGVKGQIIRYVKAPNLMYEEVRLGQLTITSGSNGTIAWEINPLSGAKIHKDGLGRILVREASLHADVHWRKYFPMVKTVKMEQIRGADAWKVSLTSSKNDKQWRWFDKNTGRLLRIRDIVGEEKSKKTITTEFLKYKRVSGVDFPVQLQKVIAGQRINITISSVEANVNIPAIRLELPKKVKDKLKDA